MIILPDRNIPRARFLMQIPESHWRAPSQAVPRDQLGNPIVETVFRVRAKTHDGVVIWTGWFEDRADFDAFLWAIALGTLPHERALWELPTPMWPGLDPGLVYDFLTRTYLTSTSQTSYTKPADWNDGNNYVEGIGGGGSGGDTNITGAPGGGAGAYSKAVNVALSGNPNYRCGAANTTTTIGSGTSVSCNSWFKDGSTLVAAGAAKGGGGSGTTPGGTTANSVGSTLYKGGDGGGGYTNGAAGFGGGGGGAGGPDGAGTNGQSGSSGQVWGKGGNGNNGQTGGGTGGQTASAVGGEGTYWTSSPNRGPGGGGAGSTNSLVAGGAGGNYGTGGGGGSAGGGYFVNGGVGKQGFIVVSYEPYKALNMNMPMLGM